MDVLEKACRSLEVEIRTGASVSAIRTERGAVVGVTLASGEEVAADYVLSTCDPKTTFLGLVGRRNMSDRLAGSIANIRMRGMTAKLNVALSGDLVDGAGKPVSLYRSGVSLDALERAYDAAKYGRCPRAPCLMRPSRSGVCTRALSIHSGTFAPYH